MFEDLSDDFITNKNSIDLYYENKIISYQRNKNEKIYFKGGQSIIKIELKMMIRDESENELKIQLQ